MEKRTYEVGTNSNGAYQIVLERNSQIDVHGFDEDHDKANNAGELNRLAIYLLDPDNYPHEYPGWWNEKWKQKFLSLSPQERRIRAGAVIAAEYDRVEAEEKLNNTQNGNISV